MTILHDEGAGDAEEKADDGQHRGFAQDDGYDGGLGGAHGFEDADFPGALQYGGVHGLKDDQEADDDGDPVTVSRAMLNPGILSGVMVEGHSCVDWTG